MPTNDLTGKPLKHYGQDDVTKERYVVIALQNETDPNTCSVIPYDKLDTDMRSELLAVVNSDECQRLPEIWKVLDRKFFYSYPNQTMLKVLGALRKILKVDQNRVKIEISPDMTMTPKEIVDAIHVYEAEKGKKHQTIETSIATPAPVAETSNTEIDEMKTRLNNVEEQIGTLSNNIAELIGALKSSMAKPE